MVRTPDEVALAGATSLVEVDDGAGASSSLILLYPLPWSASSPSPFIGLESGADLARGLPLSWREGVGLDESSDILSGSVVGCDIRKRKKMRYIQRRGRGLIYR